METKKRTRSEVAKANFAKRKAEEGLFRIFAHKTRAYLTKEQDEILRTYHRQGVYLFNDAVAQRQDYYRLNRFYNKEDRAPYPGLKLQVKQLSECREFLTFTEVDKTTEEETKLLAPIGYLKRRLKQVDVGYNNFFSYMEELGKLKAELAAKNIKYDKRKHNYLRKVGTPKRKSWRKSPPSVIFERAGVSKNEGGVKEFKIIPLLGKNYARVVLPKLGEVRFRKYFDLTDKQVRECVLSFEHEKWFISFIVREEKKLIYHEHPDRAVGLDRGVTHAITDSNGTHFDLPSKMADLEKRIRMAQRNTRRMKKMRKLNPEIPEGEKGWASNNCKKAYKKIAKLQAKKAAIRRAALHRISTHVVKENGLIVLEDLKVRNMTASAKGTIQKPGKNVKAKAALNHAILNAGWGMFRSMVETKAEKWGAKVAFVNPAYTSQTCSSCGHVDSENRKSQAKFLCTKCGFEMNADHNAAIVIKERHLASSRGSACGGVSHCISLYRGDDKRHVVEAGMPCKNRKTGMNERVAVSTA